MTNKKFYVYALCYPNGTIFYYGKSTRDRDRLKDHINYAKWGYPDKKSVIIRDLLNVGKQPILKVLFETDDEFEALQVEAKIIEQNKDKSIINYQAKSSKRKKGRHFGFEIYPEVEQKFLLFKSIYCDDNTPQYEILNNLFNEILDQKLSKLSVS